MLGKKLSVINTRIGEALVDLKSVIEMLSWNVKIIIKNVRIVIVWTISTDTMDDFMLLLSFAIINLKASKGWFQ